MRTKFRAVGRRALELAAIVALTSSVAALLPATGQAALPIPTVTSVVVEGTILNRVVTGGTTVRITGSGFAGMTDNSADPACSVTPVALSKCSQVRFNGLSANSNSTGYTLATRYSVLSNTTIVAVVPTISALAPATGAPVAGTGSVRVVVVNTMPGATSSLSSAPGTIPGTEVLYRHALGATLQSSSVTPSPLGGGTIAVDVSNVAPLTSGAGGTLAAEKITALFTSVINGSPTVLATTVAYGDADTVNVTVPPGTPDGDYVRVTLVHDGIIGTPDSDSVKYPAFISAIATCSAFTPPINTLPLPTCAGTASSNASPFYAKLSGKGFTNASNITFDGSDGNTTEDCSILSDSVAYCMVTVITPPTNPIIAVSFTPGDPDSTGPGTPPTLVAGAGAVFSYSI